MSQTLLNKVAVITGAGSGIGRATAERFLAEGAKVVLFSRSPAPLEEIAARAPARALAVAGDVTVEEDLARLAAAATRRFGEVDVLVSAAGVARIAPFVETDPAVVDEQYRVNFLGTLNAIRRFLPHLNEAAAVICLTGRMGDDCGLGAFNATKAAVAALARSLAFELAHRRIRVNCIAPGPTRTALWHNSGLSQSKPEAQAKGTTTVPLACAAGFDEAIRLRDKAARLCTPQEVADVALFLASDAARQVTGQEIVVDGGYGVG